MPSPTVVALEGPPPFGTADEGWWGYRVGRAGQPAFEFWVLRPDIAPLGDGYIQREAADERLGDGRTPDANGAPEPDDYYDAVWNHVVDRLLGRLAE